MGNIKKTILITGGNTGIGLGTAKHIASEGHRVVLACRNLKKAEEAKQAVLKQTPTAEVLIYSLDLASFESIHAFAKQFLKDFPSFDALINNAGVFPVKQQFTADGFEQQWGVNYLGHFLLTHLLLPGLQNTADARIVHLSSIMHNLGKIDFDSFKGEKRYSGVGAYGQSKLGNLLFSNALASRLPANITSNAVHPGGVDSDIYRDLPGWLYSVIRLFLISADRAGRYVTDMAISPAWQGKTGQFKSAHGPLPVSRQSRDQALLDRLYDNSVALTGVTALNKG